jgi:hypothetical protein
MLRLKANIRIQEVLIYGFGIVMCVLGFWMTTSPLVQINLLGLRLC